MIENKGDLFARFAVEKNKINHSGVHRKLFQPRKDLTLSVEMIDSLDRDDVIQAGLAVAEERGKALYGWAEVQRDKIEGIGLSVCVDDRPRPGHATISGWPEDKHISLELEKRLTALSSIGDVFPCCTAQPLVAPA